MRKYNINPDKTQLMPSTVYMQRPIQRLYTTHPTTVIVHVVKVEANICTIELKVSESKNTKNYAQYISANVNKSFPPPASQIYISCIQIDDVGITPPDHVQTHAGVASIQTVQLWLEALCLEGHQHVFTLELLRHGCHTQTDRVRWAAVHRGKVVLELSAWKYIMILKLSCKLQT